MNIISNLLEHKELLENQGILWELFNAEFSIIKMVYPNAGLGVEKSVFVGYEVKKDDIHLIYQYDYNNVDSKFFDVKVSTGKIEYNYAGDEYYV